MENINVAVHSDFVLYDKSMKKAARLADYLIMKKALFAAHGVEWTADDEKPAVAASVGFVTVDGLRWPLWESSVTLDPSPVFVSDKLTAKMKGVPAVSTDCRANPFCLARMKDPDSICSHCFAESLLNRYTASGEHAFLNTLLLSNHLVPAELLPAFGNVCFVRIESTGDVGTLLHATNYLNMIRKNRFAFFGWWSKNIAIVDKAIRMQGGKPVNLCLIQSSMFVNREEKPFSEYVDKVFTVFDADFIKEHKIEINCGARSCVRCRACYGGSDCVYIREKLKGKGSKSKKAKKAKKAKKENK